MRPGKHQLSLAHVSSFGSGVSESMCDGRNRAALDEMREGHVTHCSEELNDTPPKESIYSAAVRWNDPTGSVI